MCAEDGLRDPPKLANTAGHGGSELVQHRPQLGVREAAPGGQVGGQLGGSGGGSEGNRQEFAKALLSFALPPGPQLKGRRTVQHSEQAGAQSLRVPPPVKGEPTLSS